MYYYIDGFSVSDGILFSQRTTLAWESLNWQHWPKESEQVICQTWDFRSAEGQLKEYLHHVVRRTLMYFMTHNRTTSEWPWTWPKGIIYGVFIKNENLWYGLIKIESDTSRTRTDNNTRPWIKDHYTINCHYCSQ